MGRSQYKRMPSANADLTFKEKVKLTNGFQTFSNKLNPNPRTETTTDFYKQKGKKSKATVQIGKRKDNELEE